MAPPAGVECFSRAIHNFDASQKHPDLLFAPKSEDIVQDEEGKSPSNSSMHGESSSASLKTASKPSTSSSMQSGLCAVDAIQAEEKLRGEREEESKDGLNNAKEDDGDDYERKVTPKFTQHKSSFNVEQCELLNLRDSSMKFADDCAN